MDSLGNNETLYSKITQNAGSITSEVTRATGAEGSLQTSISSIQQTANSIGMAVGYIDLSQGTASSPKIKGSGFEMTANSVTIKTGGTFSVQSGNFSVDTSGNVSMTGTINAGANSVIGGWTLGSNNLHSGSGTSYVA